MTPATFMRLAGYCLLLQGLIPFCHAQEPVKLTEDGAAYTLSNGIVTARILKRNGDINSLKFKGKEVLTDKSGHAGGYWSHDTTGGKEVISRITIDPSSTGGERAEVSVKGISGGIKMGHGPGAAADGDFPADIEIRYTMERGKSGIYTYCEFDHLPDYPAATMTEARFGIKLADMFDWMILGDRHNKSFPASDRSGDKYIYTLVQHDNPTGGWASTTEKMGFWLVNPTVEYLSGGPTKVEFISHRDTTQVAAPVVLNYWRSSHYGGAVVAVDSGERWKKVIGPFFLYVNSGETPDAMYQDAKQQRGKELAAWPYEWVEGVDYPRAKERSTVRGKMVINDPQAPGAKTPNLYVGLTAPAWSPAGGRGGRKIDWQTDAKNYQFWVRGNEAGEFSIPDVRPGKYSLHAFTDGVLGEYLKTDVEVAAGQQIELGSLTWVPVRHGKQLWDIGIPNRNGSEFAHGSEYADPAISLKYATLFPDDVNYVIGKSDFRKDWFFQHVPHNEDPTAAPRAFYGVTSNGRATPFNIQFDMQQTVQGKAILRLAICGSGTRAIDVSLNGQPVGQISQLQNDGAITRHSIQGLWYEKELTFGAEQFKQGKNILTLTVPAGQVNNGMIYDYIRLELDEQAKTAMAR